MHAYEIRPVPVSIALPRSPRLGLGGTAALALIFLAVSIAWLILGNSIGDSTKREQPEVAWGKAQEQGPPLVVSNIGNSALVLTSSCVAARIELEQRPKGLRTYATYLVSFEGTYRFTNPWNEARRVTFEFPLPATDATYEDLRVAIDDVPVSFVTDGPGELLVAHEVPGNATVEFRASYRSHGLDRWGYRGKRGYSLWSADAPRFSLHLTTNFDDVRFAERTAWPTAKKRLSNGWELSWDYRNVAPGLPIGLLMPEDVQPGLVLESISYFAPVSLLLFFFMVASLAAIRNIELHPVNYLFLALAFFAFPWLMANLAEHMSIYWAFALSALAGLFLVVSYLRLVTGLRFALFEAGAAQFVYLILFSFGFFFKGITELNVAIISTGTLFVVMRLTGNVRWSEKLACTPTELGLVPVLRRQLPQ